MTIADLLATWVFPLLMGGVVGFGIGVVVTAARYNRRYREAAAMPDPHGDPSPSPGEDGDEVTLLPIVAVSEHPDLDDDSQLAPVVAVTAPTVERRRVRTDVVVTLVALAMLIVGGVQQAQLSARGECQADYNRAISAAIVVRASETANTDAATAADRKASRELWLSFLAIDPKAPESERKEKGLAALNAYVQASLDVDAQVERAKALRAANPLPPAPDC